MRDAIIKKNLIITILSLFLFFVFSFFATSYSIRNSFEKEVVSVSQMIENQLDKENANDKDVINSFTYNQNWLKLVYATNSGLIIIDSEEDDIGTAYRIDDEKLKKFLSGFIMINNRLKQILEHYEVRQIDALNKPFDPSFHSAIETVKVDGVEPNTVVEVVITGYTYKDRVLRPSMVKVSE